MGFDYDSLYRETSDALGAPTPEIVQAFSRFEGQCRDVLDIGCGQGRDALFIARAGHRVTGVDLSPHGVADMLAAATVDGLNVTGVVADIVGFTPDRAYDVILIDRSLHMLQASDRTAVLGRLMDHVAPDGWVLIADEPKNISSFRQTAVAHAADWHEEVVKRGYLFLRRI